MPQPELHMVSGLRSPHTPIALTGYAADITALMTYPSMFMGVGNLICMPLALAIGRRPVYLLSLLLLVASSVWAANAKHYNEHLGARMLLGFAAGQSEALVPMMIQVRISRQHDEG
jgi:predicted MFS family arabinose efflux permease